MSEIPRLSGIITSYLSRVATNKKSNRNNKNAKNAAADKKSLEEVVTKSVLAIDRTRENYIDAAIKKMVETIIMEHYGEFGRNHPATEKIIDDTFNTIKSDQKSFLKYVDYIEGLSKK